MDMEIVKPVVVVGVVAAEGFIASEGAPHAPQLTYRLTVKGRRVLA